MNIPSPMPTKPDKKKSGLAFWMQRVLEECDRAALNFAPDPVHDLRVALRRCCSIADGIAAIDPDPRWKDMKKAGKRLFRRLGELRDDVDVEASAAFFLSGLTFILLVVELFGGNQVEALDDERLVQSMADIFLKGVEKVG